MISLLLCRRFLAAGLCALALGSGPFAGATTLHLRVRSTASGEPIQPDSLRYQTAAGERFSISRVSWLASGFALQRGDGSWCELTNEVAWFDLERGRDSIALGQVPPGDYRAVRFHVGLEPAANHADPAQFGADHPLNPNLNGLHWSWQGGYIFLALEGHWRQTNGTLDGWSYHLANDPNRTLVTLAAMVSLTGDTQLEVDFDLAALLNVPRPLSFARDGASTHSRDGDPVALALAANLPGAFHVRRIEALTTQEGASRKAEPLYLPEQFTPYPFRMSATFPVPDLPGDNPLLVERVALGEKLFHEPALSKDNTISCASCHDARHAFADPRRYSVGVRDQSGTRNAMPLFNLAWKRSFFWDGRAPSLRAQALMPIQDHTEMDESLTNVVAKLRGGRRDETSTDKSAICNPQSAIAGYPELFAAAFGTPEITPQKIGLAIENYLLTLTSFDSKFDRALAGKAELTAEEKRGFELFMTEYDPRRQQYGADCFHCHGGPLFQSQTFANNGLDAAFTDRGRAGVTGREADAGKFATPSLRNVALTAPYMHDGRFATLEEVVAHYATGVKRSPTLDPNLAKHPDGGVPLSAEDQQALVAFLKTLTDEKFTK